MKKFLENIKYYFQTIFQREYLLAALTISVILLLLQIFTATGLVLIPLLLSLTDFGKSIVFVAINSLTGWIIIGILYFTGIFIVKYFIFKISYKFAKKHFSLDQRLIFYVVSAELLYLTFYFRASATIIFLSFFAHSSNIPLYNFQYYIYFSNLFEVLIISLPAYYLAAKKTDKNN